MSSMMDDMVAGGGGSNGMGPMQMLMLVLGAEHAGDIHAKLKSIPAIAALETFFRSTPIGKTLGVGIGLSKMGYFGGTIPFTHLGFPGVLGLRQFGQVTGQGTSEGLNEWIHSVGMGINPFDVISMQQAAQIESAVHQQGLHGSLGNQASDASAQLVKSMGLDYSKAVELVTQNIKTGTQSMKDFTNSLEDLKNIAKDTNQSINDVVQGFQDFTNKAIETGGRGSQIPAGKFYKTLTQTFPGIGKMGKSKSLSEFIQQQGTALTAFGGGNPLLANTAQGLHYVPKGLQNYLMNVLAAKPPNMHTDTYATMLINSGEAQQLFPGLDNNTIVNLLNRAQKGTLVSDFSKQAVKGTITDVTKAAKHPFIKSQAEKNAVRATIGVPRSYALPAVRERIEKAKQESNIESLTHTLRNNNVPANTTKAIREFLESSKGQNFSKSENIVLDNMKVILKLDGPETKKFLSAKEVNKSINLQNKQRGKSNPDTSTRGARQP